MKIRNHNKSTIEDIQQKFDNEVNKYSDINKGQLSAMDSVLIMDQVSRMAAAARPNAKNLLDIGCGAGNYTLKILQKIKDLNCTLIDLSDKMLEKANERIREVTRGQVITIQGDIRSAEISNTGFDIVIAATSLHHLRSEDEWENVFRKIHSVLKPGGVFFVSDLVLYDHEKIDQEAWKDYWEYLEETGGEELRKWAFEQIDKEDSPRSLNFQIDLMKKAGFKLTEVFYRRSVFAAFCGIK